VSDYKQLKDSNPWSWFDS